MEAAELLNELKDRHFHHLVYEGPYRLLRQRQRIELADIVKLFDDWRQRIYRFENTLGASVVLYRPLTDRSMRWDLIVTEFLGSDPFAFRYADGVTSGLRWRDVQQLLDDIKAR